MYTKCSQIKLFQWGKSLAVMDTFTLEHQNCDVKAAQTLTHTTVSSACLLQGEKYLVLKKKYRQMLQERVAGHPRGDEDGQRHPSPARSPATAAWDATHTQAVSRRSHAAAEVTYVSAGGRSVTTLKSPEVSEGTSNATATVLSSLPTQRCLCWRRRRHSAAGNGGHVA